jgi:hypothetical protein
MSRHLFLWLDRTFSWLDRTEATSLTRPCVHRRIYP